MNESEYTCMKIKAVKFVANVNNKIVRMNYLFLKQQVNDVFIM